MATANTYSAKGVKVGTTSLPKIFSEKENMILLSQAIRVYTDKRHPGKPRTLTRGEVDRTKRKVYRQKGTGGARHGARSAPIFVGGGKAHGPTGIKRKLKLSKNLSQKALWLALSRKAEEKKVIVVKGISSLKKTKEVNVLVEKIKKNEKLSENAKFTFALSKDNKEASRYIKNLKFVKPTSYRSLNVYSVFFGGTLLVDEQAFAKKIKK